MKSKALASGRLVAILPLAALALVGGAYLFLAGRAPDRETALDDDLCPMEDGRIAGSATLLLDLRKPLQEARSPETLLRGISQDMGADTELRVYALGADPSAPRQLLGRLCKPYDNADLAIETAKDQRQALRDCDDLPAQIPQRLREAASRFCARRGVLQERIQRLSERSPFEPVSNAYLMEALTQTRREFAGRPQPWKLYLHSDMLQHAPWYSQLDLDWTRWRSGYDALDDALPPWNPPGPAGLTVTIHYLPRQNSTEPTRPRRLHQEFWRHWLQGADLAFRDEPPLPAYPFLPLMDLSSKGQEEAPSPSPLDSERQKTEQLLERMAQAREELEAQQAREAQDEQARRQQEQELQRLERELQAMRERQSPPAEAAEPDAGQPAPATEPQRQIAAENASPAEPPSALEEAPQADASELAAAEEAPSTRPQVAAEPDAGRPAPATEPQRQIAAENASPAELPSTLEEAPQADASELAAAEEAPSAGPQVAAEPDASQPAPAPEPQRQIVAEDASPPEPTSALEEAPEADAPELAAAEDTPSARPQIAAEPDAGQPAPAPEPQRQIAAEDASPAELPSTLEEAPQADASELAAAEAQASAADSGDSGLAPCTIRLQPQFLAELEANDYPGGQRVHYGAGMLIVQYALDEAGATLDNQVSVRPQSADGFQPEDFQALARDTLEQVRSWAFDFEPPDGGACAKGGPRMATFEYRSKCVGAPVPSCRTVRANVALP